jgi:hypothetical protein
MTDNDWNRPHPNRPAALPRPPKPGEEVWRLRDSDTGRVQTCALRDNSRAGAGWEVMLLESGELLFSRHCENERIARYIAEAARKDLLRTGSTKRPIRPERSSAHISHASLERCCYHGLRFMPEAAEILAARVTRIKALFDAVERASLESEALRDTFLKLKQGLEARISVRQGRPGNGN